MAFIVDSNFSFILHRRRIFIKHRYWEQKNNWASLLGTFVLQILDVTRSTFIAYYVRICFSSVRAARQRYICSTTLFKRPFLYFLKKMCPSISYMTKRTHNKRHGTSRDNEVEQTLCSSYYSIIFHSSIRFFSLIYDYFMK